MPDHSLLLPPTLFTVPPTSLAQPKARGQGSLMMQLNRGWREGKVSSWGPDRAEKGGESIYRDRQRMSSSCVWGNQGCFCYYCCITTSSKTLWLEIMPSG